MATTTYFDHVLDPATGQTIEVCDKYAREQLVHKVEKTIVNSLPSKPTNYEDWLDMEPFLYYVPISGQPNEYQVWTLFFTGDPTDPSDYTDPNNYEWAQIADTDVDLNNFSTKGHTHEVIPEVEVDDHEYTPQGQVVSEFEGGTSTTSENTHNHTFTPEGSVSGNFSGSEGNTSENTHNHSFTPEGSVSSSFSGSEGTTGNSTTGISITPDKKKLSTKKLNVSPATAVNFQGSTTNAQRATGNLEALSSYDAAKAVFNGIDVQDGVLSFVTKKMTTADTVSSLQGSIDASKVSFDSQGTVTNQDIATGGVENDNNGTLLGTGTTLSDSGHTHSFTPAGSVTSSFTGSAGTTGNHSHTHTFTPTGSLVNLAFTGTAGTTGSNTHTHTLQAAGSVLSAFRGLRANLKHKVDSKKVRTSPDEYDPSGNVFDWYGIEFDETEPNPIKTRIGSLNMHRMLPIQTKMRRCLLNDDGTVNYYLDDRDSTKRAGSQEGYVTSEETFMSKVETDEIRDETEEIGVIKGNSVTVNQLASDDYTDTNYWNKTGSGSISKVGNTLVYSNVSGEFSGPYVFIGGGGFITGHKYYYTFTAKKLINELKILIATSEGGSDWGDLQILFTLTNSFSEYNGVFSATSNRSRLTFLMRDFAEGTTGDFVSIKDVMVIDLTLMGIDSFTTVEQVEAYLAENFGQRSYYPYNTGTLLSNTMKGIQTVGFNKWDEEWEVGYLGYSASNMGQPVTSSNAWRCKNHIPVIEGQTYYIKHHAVGTHYVWTYDSNKTGLSLIAMYEGINKVVIPSGVKYIKIADDGTTYNHDICINIFDPVKNGTYEPYNLHSYQRDVTQITGINPNTGVRELVAPNGLQKADMAGTVIDSIYNDVNGNAVCKKMCGNVDLGTLTVAQSLGGADLYYVAITEKSVTSTKLVCGRYKTNNGKFTDGNLAYAGMQDKEVASGEATDLYIKDSSYTSNPSGLKTSLNGVYLIYELATPILYTDLQWGDGSPVILPIEIEAEKNATIDIVSNFDKPDTLMAAPTLQMKKYVLTQGANLDGSDGQVMVEIPEHWRKVYRYTGANSHDWLRAMISPYPQEGSGWIHVKKGYVSAYEASIIAGKLCSVSNIVDLTLSIVNGKIQASCDVSTATGQSDITSQLPTTNQTMDAFRTAARARGNEGEFKWNENVYEQNIAWIWLYWIEYANLNSQADFVSALDANGYHQGGLGAGVTTISSGNWSSFNGYKPFVPCGITNCLGNQTGEVYLAIPSGLGGGTVKVNSYRGIELPFGHIWKFADGIKYLGDGTQQAVLRCDNPANYSSEASSTNYTSIGNNYGSNGWKTKIMIGSDGDINCAAAGGAGAGDNGFYCDYNYQAHASGTYYCCLLGGSAGSSSVAGLVYVCSGGGVTLSRTTVGSRLCFFEK